MGQVVQIGIRTKIVLITTGIMSIAIGATILVSSRHFSEAYTQALQSRSLSIGMGLKLQLDRLLHLGIRLENLTGFDEQCRDVVNKYEGIQYAMVADDEGRILFHSDASRYGSKLIDQVLLNASKSRDDVVALSSAGHGIKSYTALIPIIDVDGRHIGAVGIGFPADIINAKTRDSALFSIGVGLLFLAGASITLLAALSTMVIKPLTRLLEVVQEMRKKGEVFTREVEIGAKDEIGQLGLAFNMMTNNLRATTVSKEVLEYQATHDMLTGLPNRNLLADRLQQAVFSARRHGKQIAVFFMDLDNFKFINDSLGHGMGDQVLAVIASRIIDSVRSSDTVSRQAGDEFVIIVSDIAGPDDAAKVAGKIVETVAKPLIIDDHDLTVTCSIGVSLFPKDGEDVSELLKNADAALYRAKEQGKNGFQFFTAEMNARLSARMRMERQLRLAIEREEFVLYYQPKVSLRSGRIVGMEALIRWQHPERGIERPGEFIPLAEETGLIEQIGEWVLRTASKQAKAWQDAGLPKLPVAVNVSVRQLRHEVLAEMVRRAIGDAGLDPACVELEVTESLLILNTDSVQSILRGLKDIGVLLVMDDFGTGYSSLGYLQRFPFDKLKLDIAFVREITRDPNSAAIALAVITMAHTLNLKVIAEGVETEGQMSYLRLHGCDEMQGNYFSHPLPVADFERLILEDRALPIPTESDEEAEKELLIVDDAIDESQAFF